jgi:hypothetical protein
MSGHRRDASVCKMEVSPVPVFPAVWGTMMTVLQMNKKEMTQFDKPQRKDRGDLHADDAALSFS